MAVRRLVVLLWLAGCGYGGSTPSERAQARYADSAVDPAWRPYTTLLGHGAGATEKKLVAALGEPTHRRDVAADVVALQWAVPGPTEPEPSMVTAVLASDGLQALGVTGKAAASEMRSRGHTDPVLDFIGQPLESAVPRLPPGVTSGRRAARVQSSPGKPPIRVDLRTDLAGKVLHVGISWAEPTPAVDEPGPDGVSEPAAAGASDAAGGPGAEH